MWFKTRVGLVSITDPTEILVSQNPQSRRWSIYCRLKDVPEIEKAGFFKKKKRRVSNPWSHLALFSDGPDVRKALGECMAKIERAILTKAEICDLSESGDAEAWEKAWQQIAWPKQTPG